MSSSNQRFVLKYVLPDGKVAGYHADSGCTIALEKKQAKVYDNDGTNSPEEQIPVVQDNFEYVWGQKPEYREYPIWKGHSVDQIKIVAEFI